LKLQIYVKFNSPIKTAGYIVGLLASYCFCTLHLFERIQW